MNAAVKSEAVAIIDVRIQYGIFGTKSFDPLTQFDWYLPDGYLKKYTTSDAEFWEMFRAGS